MNREAWLTKAATLAAKNIFALDLPAMRVSCGFPATGATAKRRRRVGECWNPSTSEAEVSEVFISPLVHDAYEVVGILVHEMIHAYHPEAGHKGAFITMAQDIGLVGPWTATSIGDDLKLAIEHGVLAKLPDYPHAKMTVGTKEKTQSTRMLKAECPDDGYTVRLTRKWVEVGMPTCPCGTELVLEDKGEGG